MNTKVESLFFVMVSFDQAFIGKTAQDFYNSLYYRKYPFCEVAVVRSATEADCYIQQHNYANFLSNPHLYGFAPMPLPVNSVKIGYNIRTNKFVEINADSETASTTCAPASENVPATFDFPQSSRFSKPVVHQNVNDGLFWAVDAINGFDVTDNLNALIYILADRGLIYAHALPYGDEFSAAVYSRSAYLDRFACRYNFNEDIELPTDLIRNGQVFIDPDYENREARRSNNPTLNRLLSLGLF